MLYQVDKANFYKLIHALGKSSTTHQLFAFPVSEGNISFLARDILYLNVQVQHFSKNIQCLPGWTIHHVFGYTAISTTRCSTLEWFEACLSISFYWHNITFDQGLSVCIIIKLINLSPSSAPTCLVGLYFLILIDLQEIEVELTTCGMIVVQLS